MIPDSPGRSRLLLLPFAGLLLTLLGCEAQPFEIAVILPETGIASTYGQSIKEGVEIAAQQLAASDYEDELSFSYHDSQSDPAKAQELLSAAFDAGADAAIGGGTSAEAKEMVSVADRYQQVVLSPSASSPELTGISENFFRIFPSDFTEASKMANFATQDLEVQKVVVVAEEREYAKGIQEVFRTAFEGYGGEVLETIEFPRETTDFSGLADRVRTVDPDAVYIAAYESGAGSMIQELRKLGFPGKILATHALAAPAALARIGDDAVGVFLTQTVFEVGSDHAHIRTFVEAYRKAYGHDPDIFAAHGYDAVMVLAEAIEGRPRVPGEVQKGLRSVEDFPGVTGSIRFDEKGDVPKYPRVYKVMDDLGMYDYNELVQEKRREVAEKRRQMQEQLERLRREAQQIGDGG